MHGTVSPPPPLPLGPTLHSAKLPCSTYDVYPHPTHGAEPHHRLPVLRTLSATLVLSLAYSLELQVHENALMKRTEIMLTLHRCYRLDQATSDLVKAIHLSPDSSF
ncbi:hypothetical protein GUJ93_ZPchr0012g19176 [Zizania palustris]|uniref:Uncharacterized protein n=1 Tax=Zizania palustris TaxID=103762 RepID=A0A8J5WN22_ZIZPA|nr:hypothetical protein GUJ93_ZPchr0012g19176 [Zizania palustris]